VEPPPRLPWKKVSNVLLHHGKMLPMQQSN
jgi:hypothetical protein